jgi:hypothetical protein
VDTLERHGRLCAAIAIFFIVVMSTPATAVVVTLSSGKSVDLAIGQVKRLKQQPGIYFSNYEPGEMMDGTVASSILIRLPEELGGGSLTSTAENMKAGSQAVGAVKEDKAERPGGAGASPLTTGKKTAPRIESELVVSAGYRVDDFDWNIAGDIDGNSPNILSELTWDDLEIYQLELYNKTIVREVFYLRGSLSYGWIKGGDNQDSDYLEDNRALEFSRSNNDADDGNTLDASLGIGYPFTFGSGFVGLTPLVGYSYHEQNLTMTDGNQTITWISLDPDFPDGPPLGPMLGLDNTYEAQWKGPWVGFDLIFTSKDVHRHLAQVEAYVNLEYHWADYCAEADWNLRTDFAHPKSFEHDADGDGIVLSAGWNVVWNDHWALNANFDYQDWSTDHGTDRTFFSDGSVEETRLNEVNWKSYAVMVGLSYRF